MNSINKRNIQVEENIELVYKIAWSIKKEYFIKTDIDELIQYGSFGLIKAVEKYNPEYNNTFSTYAYKIIKGSIIDGLRDIDWIPRSTRDKVKEVSKAIAHFEGDPDYSPYDIATDMGLNIFEYHILKNNHITSLHILGNSI